MAEAFFPLKWALKAPERVVAPVEEEVLRQEPLLGGDGGVALELLRVHDGHVEARLRGVVEEDAVQDLAARLGEAEAHVGDAQDRLGFGELGLDEPEALDGLRGAAPVGRVARPAGEDQGVEDEVLRRHAVLVREEFEGAAGHGQLALPGDGHALPGILVDGPHHEGRPEGPGQWDDALESRLPLLQVHGIDDAFPLAEGEGLGDDGGVGGVDHEGRPDHLHGLLQEGAHVGELVAVRVLQAHVHHLGPGLHLAPGHLGRSLEIPRGDTGLELAAPQDVGALAHEDGAVLILHLEEVGAREEGPVVVVHPAGLESLHGPGEGGDVGGRRTAAASHDVEPALLGEAQELGCKGLGRLGVLPVLVWEPRVGVARDRALGHGGQGTEVARHLLRPRGAVEPHGEEGGVHDGGVHGLDGLPREHGPVGFDGHGHGHGYFQTRLVHGLAHGQEARLQVARVLHGLQEEEVRASLEETDGLHAVVLDHLLEGGPPGDRDGLRGGPHGARHEPRPVRGGPGGAGLSRDLGGPPVDLDGLLGEAVLREDEGRAAEGVGLHDVGPRLEVGVVHRADHVGPGEDEGLVASLQVGAAEVLGGEALGLEEDARAPVQDRDALLEQFHELFGPLVHAVTPSGHTHRGMRNAPSHGAVPILSQQAVRYEPAGKPGLCPRSDGARDTQRPAK